MWQLSARWIVAGQPVPHWVIARVSSEKMDRARFGSANAIAAVDLVLATTCIEAIGVWLVRGLMDSHP